MLHYRSGRAVAVLLTLFIVPTGFAQQPAAAPATQPDKPQFTQQELDQMIAPLALYPDSLLAQVFMASTYPLEIVQADRWVKANPSLKGDALATELEKQTWDASVKSLVNFPDVLSMLSEKIDLTMKLGDAFIEQQPQVMATVQSLRAKAQAAGNLKETKEQKVIVEQAPPSSTTTTQTTIIKIEPTQPEVVYVPQYNPTVVYGTWPYPAYPPYPYRPPGYWTGAAIGFGVGVACGAAWGYAWGGCNWGHGDVDIDVNRNTNFNRNIDRSKYQNQINRNNTKIGSGNRANTFQHNPEHRKGVAYRDNKTASKFGGVSDRQASQAREQYRGRTDSGFGGNRPGAGGGGVQNRPGDVNRPGGQDRPGAGGGGVQNRPGDTNRPGAGGGGVQNRPSGQDRPGAGGSGVQNRSSSGTRSGSFDGARDSGSSTRMQSQRGSSSRAPTRSAPSRSGGGGGGARGGGGRRR